MSIRIDNDQLAGVAAPHSGQTEQVRSTGSRSSWGVGKAGASSDSVQMSSMAEGILGASAADSSNKAQRVQELAAMYAAGSYDVDSRQLSRAMVLQAITSPAGGIG